jgi:CheY-like chemotaxis protein
MKAGGPVLLVEDDLDIAEAILDVLMDEGYEVAHATNGLEALDLLRSQMKPSLILLDLMMPDMDGPHFRQVQLSDPRLCRIPVVVVSADRMIEEKAHELGIVDFITKPMHPQHLLSVVERTAHGDAN